MSRQFNLTKTSLKKINNFLDSVEDKIDDEQFFKQFESIVFLDVKRIKDCAESVIVDFYIETCQRLLDKNEYEIYESFEFRPVCKESDCYKCIGSNVGQATLRKLDKNWKSFFAAIKDYSKNPSRRCATSSTPYRRTDCCWNPTIVMVSWICMSTYARWHPC